MRHWRPAVMSFERLGKEPASAQPDRSVQRGLGESCLAQSGLLTAVTAQVS
jgi:hypothetical protein